MSALKARTLNRNVQDDNKEKNKSPAFFSETRIDNIRQSDRS